MRPLDTGGTPNLCFTVNGFRLTLTTAVPVTTTDVIGATSIYFTPYKSNEIWTYYGAVWTRHTSAEISLALSALTVDRNYDLFVYWNGSALVLEHSIWTDNTNRATAIVRQDGVWCKNAALDRRYVGTFRSVAANQTNDNLYRRLLWNADNRVERKIKATDATDSWTYNTVTWRPANNDTTNGTSRVEIVRGLDEDLVDVVVTNYNANSAANGLVAGGVGVDSTTVNAADVMGGGPGTAQALSHYSRYQGYPGIGYHYLQRLETGDGSGATTTWYGDAALSYIQTGMVGTVLA